MSEAMRERSASAPAPVSASAPAPVIASAPAPAPPIDAMSLTSSRFVNAASRRGMPRERSLDIYRAIHRRGVLPDDPGHGAAAGPSLPPFGRTLIDGDTVKFTLEVGGGLETESVVIPMPHAGGGFSRTLCVSSQVGCAMGCTFCETAQMGLMRHLAAREIVAQWFAARHLVDNPFEGAGARGFEIRNLVFMGMGEPMDNLDAVLEAVEILCDRNGAGVAASRVSISTVGRTDGIRRLGEFIRRPGFHRVNLAVSVNAPNDEIRSRIMPINRAEPMSKLMAALLEFPRRPTAAICVEYVLIPGVNDAPEHCDEVCAYLRPLRCSLNVIPYNPRRDSPWRAPTEEQITSFVQRAVSNGQFCKRRQTKGRAAMAACGQLGNERIRGRRLVTLPAGAADSGPEPATRSG